MVVLNITLLYLPWIGSETDKKMNFNQINESDGNIGSLRKKGGGRYNPCPKCLWLSSRDGTDIEWKKNE